MLGYRHLLYSLLCAALTACAGKFDYVRPATQPSVGANTKLIDRPRDAVWASSVPELGKRFYVINNLDMASGLMNVSYSGDPERLIDCGRVTSFVKNARGERTYDFAGAKAQQSYEVMYNNNLFFIDRRMGLEGRVNLIFEEVSPNSTRVTANTRYVVTRSQTIRAVSNNVSQSFTDSITFNSGGGTSFPANSQGQAVECIATGELEREILSAVR